MDEQALERLWSYARSFLSMTMQAALNGVAVPDVLRSGSSPSPPPAVTTADVKSPSR